ncbi:hypothetical protein FRZ67_15570 [Panacibacter ginsenosidivorans]|uniref:Cytochrome c domain-containing protein n=1 Tax=Panacibacter ginsenosidivorans TaxID=1813871 RepID=A0A5B8VB01_9BACT|nr:c-type cytochrome [Panacibacter ginsenosidivorans]QEC68657.1 hypothetical protein FRZ67_15570 [Panacibacter ginsenosidivorans]
MKKMITALSVIFAATVFIISCKHDAMAPQTTLLFPKVKAIIQANCVECHSPGGQGLPVNLTSDDAIVQDAALIKAATVDPASPRNRRMPPNGDLPEADKTIIAQWFEEGGTTTN